MVLVVGDGGVRLLEPAGFDNQLPRGRILKPKDTGVTSTGPLVTLPWESHNNGVGWVA